MGNGALEDDFGYRVVAQRYSSKDKLPAGNYSILFKLSPVEWPHWSSDVLANLTVKTGFYYVDSSAEDHVRPSIPLAALTRTWLQDNLKPVTVIVDDIEAEELADFE